MFVTVSIYIKPHLLSAETTPCNVTAPFTHPHVLPSIICQLCARRCCRLGFSFPRSLGTRLSWHLPEATFHTAVTSSRSAPSPHFTSFRADRSRKQPVPQGSFITCSPGNGRLTCPVPVCSPSLEQHRACRKPSKASAKKQPSSDVSRLWPCCRLTLPEFCHFHASISLFSSLNTPLLLSKSCKSLLLELCPLDP